MMLSLCRNCNTCQTTGEYLYMYALNRRELHCQLSFIGILGTKASNASALGTCIYGVSCVVVIASDISKKYSIYIYVGD